MSTGITTEIIKIIAISIMFIGSAGAFMAGETIVKWQGRFVETEYIFVEEKEKPET